MFSEPILQSFITAPSLAESCEKKENQSPPPGCPRREIIPQTPEDAIAILNDIYQQLVTVRQSNFLEHGSQVDESLADALTAVLNASDNISDIDRTQV